VGIRNAKENAAYSKLPCSTPRILALPKILSLQYARIKDSLPVQRDFHPINILPAYCLNSVNTPYCVSAE
jgi:hypothetical protein